MKNSLNQLQLNSLLLQILQTYGYMNTLLGSILELGWDTFKWGLVGNSKVWSKANFNSSSHIKHSGYFYFTLFYFTCFVSTKKSVKMYRFVSMSLCTCVVIFLG